MATMHGNRIRGPTRRHRRGQREAHKQKSENPARQLSLLIKMPMRATAKPQTIRLPTKRAAAKPKTTHLPTKVPMLADVPLYVLVLAREQHHPTSKSLELCSPSSIRGSTAPE